MKALELQKVTNVHKPGSVSDIFIFLHKNAQNVTVNLLHMGFGGALGGAPCRKKGEKNAEIHIKLKLTPLQNTHCNSTNILQLLL